jgi:hypothetical protein
MFPMSSDLNDKYTCCMQNEFEYNKNKKDIENLINVVCLYNNLPMVIENIIISYSEHMNGIVFEYFMKNIPNNFFHSDIIKVMLISEKKKKLSYFFKTNMIRSCTLDYFDDKLMFSFSNSQKTEDTIFISHTYKKCKYNPCNNMDNIISSLSDGQLFDIVKKWQYNIQNSTKERDIPSSRKLR